MRASVPGVSDLAAMPKQRRLARALHKNAKTAPTGAAAPIGAAPAQKCHVADGFEAPVFRNIIFSEEFQTIRQNIFRSRRFPEDVQKMLQQIFQKMFIRFSEDFQTQKIFKICAEALFP